MDESVSHEASTGAGTERELRPDPELVSVVVEHENRADRCTFYHPDATGVDRMSNWITADVETVVDLYYYR